MRLTTLVPVLFTFFTATDALSGYFWHVTDFHFDENYTTVGDASAMCWKPADDTTPSSNNSKPMGQWGDYRCDSPYTLVKSAINAMKEFGSEPDFILWTGDDKAHVGDGFFDTKKVLRLITNLTNTLTGPDGFPSVQLVPVLGNHDWYPTHAMPPNASKMYDEIADLWEKWIGKNASDTFRQGGYYSMKLPNGNRIVVLNTVLYYTKNKAVGTNNNDPADQLKWLESILEEARRTGDQVYVTAHVPPGIFERHFIKHGFHWFHMRFNKRYVDLMSTYGDVIAAQFYAHQHTDSFRIFYDSQGVPTSFILLAPSVTPWNTTLSQVGPNNPGVRQVFYDTKNGTITDYNQYYLNLTLADKDNNQPPNWQFEYSAREAFGIDGPLTARALDSVAQSFTTSNRTLFNRYYLYNSVSYQSPEECDSYCQRYHYCAITRVDFNDFEKCRANGAGNGANFIGKWWTVLVAVTIITLVNNNLR